MEDLQPSDILIHIINILVLFVLLRAILFKPINKFLAARTERIGKQLKDAVTIKAEAIELKQVYEQHIAAYEHEGRDILRDSQLKASQEATAIVKEARSLAETLIADAQVRISSEKAQAVSEARTDVVLLATEIAARILKREVSVVDNKTIAEDFFREVR